MTCVTSECVGVSGCHDVTSSICGGGLVEDSYVPNDEVSVCMTVVRLALAASVAGYEADPMTVDPAVDSCVLMLLVVVESSLLDCEDSVYCTDSVWWCVMCVTECMSYVWL